MVDLHTHILYGWDDGAETLEDSLAMARLAAADGTTVIAATPHMMWSDVRIEPRMVEDRVAEINAHIAAESLNIRVVTGCEVPAVWDHFNLIKHKQVLTLGGSHTLLFEPPFNQHPVQFPDLLFQVRMMGYTVLLAHPERSEPFLDDHALFRRIVGEDIAVQVTASSLTGSYGNRIQDFAWEIVREARPVVIASDGHGVERRRPCLGTAYALLVEELGLEAADLMCRDNPTALLEDRPTRIARIERETRKEESVGLGGRIRRAFTKG